MEHFMMFVKYFGVFLFLLGVWFLIVKRKQENDTGTWEGNHGIKPATWHGVSSLVLGLSIVFVCNLYTNYQEYYGESAQVNERSIEESRNGDNEEEKSVSSERKPGDDTIYESSQREEVNSFTDYNLYIGDRDVSVTIPDSWKTNCSYLICYPEEFVSVNYGESYIKVGDKEDVLERQSSIDEIWECSSELREIPFGDMIGYAIIYGDNSSNYILLYEPIPHGTTYMEIEICDCSLKYTTEELINMCTENLKL